ncbi:MAG TPA: Smr/MutS family protein [Syntrophorhabdaceae bacterium]|nr:Smr/MutS family protein [Syntrophorhabdaceae bacterium]
MKNEDNFYKALSNLKEIINKTGIKICKVNGGNVSFQDAMKDVKQIKWTKATIIKKPLEKDIFLPKRREEVTMDELLSRNGFLNVINLPEYMEGYVENINPIVMEKLRNGEFSIQDTLDLHGYRKEDARILFENFIQAAIKNKLNCVKIIHGRGLKSKGTPVLKDNLVKWLIKAMNRKWVAAFASCRMCDGGPGATYILLKKRPEKKKISIIK